MVGDAYSRWYMDQDGSQYWGSGSAAADVSLSRVAAGVLGTAALAIGPSPASVGALRIPYNVAIAARNSTNSGDVYLAYVAGNALYLGDNAAYTVISPSMLLIGNGAGTYSNTARSIQWTTTYGLLIQGVAGSAYDLFLCGPGGSIMSVATGTTTAHFYGHLEIGNGGYLYSPKGTVGTYSPSYARLVYAMGDAYKGASDVNGFISSFTSLYGMVYVYDDNTGSYPLNWTGHGLGHGIAILSNGAYASFVGSAGIHTTGNIYAGANVIAGSQVDCNTLSVTNGISCGGLSVGGYSPTVVRTGPISSGVPGDLASGQLFFGY